MEQAISDGMTGIAMDWHKKNVIPGFVDHALHEWNELTREITSANIFILFLYGMKKPYVR